MSTNRIVMLVVIAFCVLAAIYLVVSQLTYFDRPGQAPPHAIDQTP